MTVDREREERRRHLGFDGMKVAEALIREHSDISPDPAGGKGLIAYHDGWDDERIAKETGAKLHRVIGAPAIERFRRVHVGGLADRYRPDADGRVNRIDVSHKARRGASTTFDTRTYRVLIDLVERVDRLEKQMTEFEKLVGTREQWEKWAKENGAWPTRSDLGR